MAWIILQIEPKLLYIIGNRAHPEVVWNKLRDSFPKKSCSNKLRLKRKLCNMRLKQSDELKNVWKISLKYFIHLLWQEMWMILIKDEDRVIKQLKMKIESSNYLKIIQLLWQLSGRWKSSNAETVTGRFLHEERKRKECDGNSGESKSLVSMNFTSKVLICFECGKLGHIRKNCYVLIEKKYIYSPPNRTKANIVWKNRYNTEDDVILIATKVMDTHKHIFEE